MAAAHPVTNVKTPIAKVHIDRPLTAKESGLQFSALLNAPLPQSSLPTPSPPATTLELPQLLQRFCSALYVDAQPSAHTSRMLLTLDGALPGAAAELIREGAFLKVRLRASNDTALRVMSGQRDSLNAALTQVSPLNVIVEVVSEQEAHGGRAR